MRTLSEKIVKIQFFKFLWNPSGFGLTQRENMWIVGKRERGEKCNYPVNCKPVMISFSWVYSTL